MYRAHSPLFEVPEYPALRRIKPMPKRRRTSDHALTHAQDVDEATALFASSALNLDVNAANAASYMADIYGNEQPFSGLRPSVDFPAHYAGAAVRTDDDDDQGEGDYIDHLQQPGNTKKRKVPSAARQLQGGLDSPRSPVTNDEELSERATTTRSDAEGGDTAKALAAQALGNGRRKLRTSPVTIAGLQAKELVKARKRQFADVLGAVANRDTLALDLALGARSATVLGAAPALPKPAEYIADQRAHHKHPRRRAQGKENMVQTAPFRSGKFTFAMASPAGERFATIRNEVNELHDRLEAELARQAAEAAKQSALAISDASKRSVQRARSSIGATARADGGTNPLADQSRDGAKGRQSKKKKRSALANASNPHHLRNYVPSRLPHSGQPPPQSANAAFNAQNYLSPPPARFLAAELPPRRHRKAGTPAVQGSLAAPLASEEWICPFCEYNLFYGDDAQFRRAVRSRKKILQRRRRARERAAAAASGLAPVAPAPPADKSTTIEAPLPAPEEPAVPGDISTGKGQATKRDRDKGGLNAA